VIALTGSPDAAQCDSGALLIRGPIVVALVPALRRTTL